MIFFGGDAARALQQSRGTLERFPDSLLTWHVLGLSHLSLGQAREAVSALEEATSLSREPMGLGYLGCAYALVGRLEDARALLDELLTRKAERFVPLKPFILLYTALGDIGRALDALETVGDLPCDPDRLRKRQRPVRQAFRECGSLDELQDERWHSVRLFEAMNVRDVRIVQRRKDLGLAAEPRQPLGVTGEMLWQDLDCDVAIEPLIARAVDLAHAAAAEKGHNFIRSEPGSALKGHAVASASRV